MTYILASRQGTGFELGHSTVTQRGSCWFAGPNSGAHQWGGTNKAALIGDAASDGWIHNNTVEWNCGGWGVFDRTQLTIMEDNRFVCTAPNNATHGVYAHQGCTLTCIHIHKLRQ